MKDDKKKLIVVLALALVIVAVGVFQFTSGGSSAPAAPTAKKEEKKVVPEEPIEPPKNPMFAANLPVRDPFKEPSSLSTEANTPPVAPMPSGEIQKPAQQFKAPPMPPISGSLEPTDNGNPNAPMTVQITEKQFSYRLSGVMLGAKPMAVFTDLQGNQRLVLLGGSLEPECNVLTITKEAVTVRFHGKTLRLTVEGNPNDK